MKSRIAASLIALALIFLVTVGAISLVAIYIASPVPARSTTTTETLPVTKSTAFSTTPVTKSVYVTSTSTPFSTTYIATTITQIASSGAPPGLLDFTLVVTCTGCTNSTTFPQYYGGTIYNGTSGHRDSTTLPGESVGQVSYTVIAHPADYLKGDWSLSWQVLLYSSTGSVEVKVYEGAVLFSDKTADPSTGFLDGSIQITVA